jgi:hypothetical protein
VRGSEGRRTSATQARQVFHISKIHNFDSAVAIVNPNSGRDSRLTLKDQEYFPDNPIEVPKYTAEGTLSYKDAEKGGLPIVKGKLPMMNIFTKTENWFIWDNGKSQLWGVKEHDPNNNHELYKGSGGNLWLTVESNGSLVFAAAK